MEDTSPERKVSSESPSWNPVNIQEPEENRNTVNTGFLPEGKPQSPAAPTDTALPEYAAGPRSNGGMFNLIIYVNERTSVRGR